MAGGSRLRPPIRMVEASFSASSKFLEPLIWALPSLITALTVGTLTKGIAGIILSIGMAVDANVIIFARIREELAVGKTVREAVKVGFNKALSAIVDGNITTLLAAGVLLLLGPGTVKGFVIMNGIPRHRPINPALRLVEMASTPSWAPTTLECSSSSSSFRPPIRMVEARFSARSKDSMGEIWALPSVMTASTPGALMM